MPLGVCDVCRILDSDYSKKEISYCSFCHANVCESDIYSPRRLQAWAKKKNISLKSLKKYLGI